MLGQVNTTGGAFVTVNVATHVFGASQSEVTVNVTDLEPPQWSGAPELLFVETGLHPPLVLTVASQALNFEFIVACV